MNRQNGIDRVARLTLLFALASIVALTTGCAGVVDAGWAQPGAGSEGAITDNSIGMKLVHIPPGKFTMGSPIEEIRREMDEVEHRVQITCGFYLGQTEVTRGQFAKFVRDAKYVTDAERAGDPETWRNMDMKQKFDHPVVYVTWQDAIAFCEWLSKKEGRNYRLPTEAEWEYAARAGSRGPFGGEIGSGADSQSKLGATISTDQANFNGTTRYGPNGDVGSYRATTTAVGEFAANTWSLHDTAGNVWEWTNDWYGRYPIELVVDPKGATEGTVKIARGGSWGNAPEYCRAAYRFGGNPETSYSTVGFRVVMEDAGLPPAPAAPEAPQTASVGSN